MIYRLIPPETILILVKMPCSSREAIIDAYLMSMVTRDIYAPYTVLEEVNTRFILDAGIIQSLENTRYLNGRHNQRHKKYVEEKRTTQFLS